MKTNVNWKPQGHSAKRWHGTNQRKDPTTLRPTASPKKKVWFQTVSAPPSVSTDPV